jgi:predicted HicB family RNase H-like nuclease
MARNRSPIRPTKKRMQLDLEDMLHAHIKALAEHDGKSMQKFVLMLLEEAIPRYEREAGLLDG